MYFFLRATLLDNLGEHAESLRLDEIGAKSSNRVRPNAAFRSL
jgi:hypothetical protein